MENRMSVEEDIFALRLFVRQLEGQVRNAQLRLDAAEHRITLLDNEFADFSSINDGQGEIVDRYGRRTLPQVKPIRRCCRDE
jgi:hypothetical protein